VSDLTFLAHTAGTAEWYWAIAADSLLVVWVALLVVAPRWGTSPRGGWRFRLWGLGAALVAAAVTWAGKTLEVWPDNPLFPSGHTAFGVTIAVFLAGRDRRWMPWVVTLVALTAVALVLANYHVPVDVAGGLIVGIAVGAGAFVAMARGGIGPEDSLPARRPTAAQTSAQQRSRKP